jgi:hypothetical protein
MYKMQWTSWKGKKKNSKLVIYLDGRNLTGALQDKLTTTFESAEDGRAKEVDTLLRHQS